MHVLLQNSSTALTKPQLENAAMYTTKPPAFQGNGGFRV
jgi:hypothetical protein